MIILMIFINIKNYHKSYFYKKLFSKFKIYRYDKSCIYLNDHIDKFIS